MPNSTTAGIIGYQDELAEKYQALKNQFKQKHHHAYQWLTTHGKEIDDVRQASQQLLAAISLAGQIALSQPVEARVQKQLEAIEKKQKNDLLSKITEQEHQEIIDKMNSYVNMSPGHLPEDEELYLEQQLTDMLGFEVTAELEGHRLNHSIGIMGGEQHLRRYPTDSLQEHDAYLEAGIAPNRGAFGWFTQNGELTKEAIQREKYYFAVQTLYLPDWNSGYQELKPWYKFRKMIAINPAEQVAVVGVVGDAGPALWVQKQFGGSPEVIREGKIWSRKSRGRVLLFFVDDPQNEISLGPRNLSLTQETIEKLAANNNHNNHR